MDINYASSCLSELGNPTRLAIFRLLVRAGSKGVIVSDIARHLGGIPGSTLSHHLTHLVRADLIVQHRTGRQLWCRARHDVMDGLIEFLTDHCCTGLPTLGEQEDKNMEETAA